MRGVRNFLFTALLVVMLFGSSFCSDWPMWGYDSGRRNAADITLSENMDLLWSRQLPEPERAWPFQHEDYHTSGNPLGIGKLSFDVSYEPVAGGGMLFVPSMVTDSVTAYSTETGEELWAVYAGGPVRFAPVYYGGRVYFVSDDGYLYCVDAASGNPVWEFRGSFAERRILGNGRIISVWPARGGPVISDGVVYFASGIMAFEGVFVHALKADTGEVVWTNSTSGSIWELHQHGGAWSYGGPSPQGYLAVSGDRLILPGGRTPPAVYDRHTGEFLYFRQSTTAVGKGAGGYRVHADGDWFFNHGMLYSLADGAQYGAVPGTVITEDSFIGARGSNIVAHSKEIEGKEAEIADRLARGAIAVAYEVRELWRQSQEDLGQVHFLAGSHLGISTADGRVALVRISGGRPAGIAWEHDAGGPVWNMIAADGKLFVAREDGKILCFGLASGSEPVKHVLSAGIGSPGPDAVSAARRIVSETGKTEGYAFASGVSGDLLKALAEITELHIIAVSEDESGAESLRRSLDEAGLYGNRVAVLKGSLENLNLPPYTAELVVLEGGAPSSETLKAVFSLVRPYGGKMYVRGAAGNFRGVFDRAELKNGSLKTGRGFAVVTREGALPGAGQWTHQYAGPSNRTYSDDELVKPPLGLLWFGGPSNANTLPRHHNGPIPQVSGGRLFILGIDTLSGRCVYTGRELWVREFPGIGHPFTDLPLEERFRAGREVYMSNHPGANFIGSPYVSVGDGVYVIREESIFRLDPATGETISDFRLPALDMIRRNEWGHMIVWEDYLIATVDPQFFDGGIPGKTETWNATSSSLIAAIDRREGRVLWVRRADRVGFRHNAIAAGNGRLYVVDGLSESVVETLQRRGMEGEKEALLMALDISTGELLWQREGAFGTWLGYYDDYDILLQGGRHGQRGVLPDEPRNNLIAHRGATGEVVWEYSRRYSGPLGLHRNMIIAGRPGEANIDPLTGQRLTMEHPLTGRDYNWSYHRYYGCGTMNSSLYLIMFRSGAAGFTDLLDFGGTGNLGGFRSGCTNNLVAADGVLNAPEYTRTCTCSYQLQSSFGFIHRPEVEMWTFNRLERGNAPVTSMGVNFGAPGNRRKNGVLWLEYPKVYGAGPDAGVRIEGASLEYFRNHASWIRNAPEGYAWVSSYGVKGVRSISVNLAPQGAQAYDIALYFAEPDAVLPGERVFDVSVQGRTVLKNFDIAEAAGGAARTLKIQISGVRVDGNLEVVFSPRGGSLPPVISGIEAVRS